MLSVGQLIWASCRPLIRLVICTGCGFCITKADIFPLVAAQGAGQIILNIALPCLMFSKIVPAFTSDNIHALGPLVLVAILYEIIGIVIALTVKRIFWVPHRFRYGVLVAGGWGNYGDIPTSVVMSIAGAAPFNGTTDQTLSVAYVSAFILVFFITLFPLGGHKWVAMDYVGPEVEDDDVKENLKLQHKSFWKGEWVRPVWGLTRSLRNRQREKPHDVELSMDGDEKHTVIGNVVEEDHSAHDTKPKFERRPDIAQGKHVSFLVDDSTVVITTDAAVSPIGSPEAGPSRVTSPAPTVTYVDAPSQITHNEENRLTQKSSNHPLHKIVATAVMFLHSIISTPASLSIIVSFIISLVPTLKALFVPGVPGTHIAPAPDGLPPLSFLIDTASFIGATSVPLGLVCLGSALARLKVPRGQWGQLPIGAIGGLAVGKILIMPVLGVLICQGLTNVGVIDKDDKVLRFVCMFFSCLPTATTQVFLTQVYSGTGNAEHLSAFLIPQYILMFVSMTALTAYSLQLLF